MKKSQNGSLCRVLKRTWVILCLLWMSSMWTHLAAATEKFDLSISAKPIAAAVKTLSYQTKHSVLFQVDELGNFQTKAISGSYSIFEALKVLLAGTNLVGGLTDSGVIVVSLSKGALAQNREEPKVNKNIKRSLLASVSAFLFGTGMQAGAMAQDVDAVADNEITMDVITVTAQKRSQYIGDIPISIVAIGAKELKERGINNFQDLSIAVPGLAVVGSGAYSRRIFMRGVANIAGASSLVGLYVDEIPVSTNPIFELDLRLFDLERVEVLRGPQGTLYGQGSAGGTIRFITKSPDLEEFGGHADIESSFTKGGEASQKIQSVINVPLITDELAIRVAGTFENAGGWIDQPAALQKNTNDQNLTNVRIKALWQPNEFLDVSLMANIHRNNAGYDSGEDENGNYTQVFDLQTIPSIEDNYELYNLTANYDFGSVNLVSATSYLSSDKKIEAVGSLFPLAPPPIPAFHIIQPDDLNIEVFNQEIRLGSSEEGPWQWTVGGFFRDAQLGRLIGPAFLGLPGPLPDGAAPIILTLDDSSRSWAVFGNTSVELGERLEFGAGLRYFKDKAEFFDGAVMLKDTFDSLNPRLYVNFDVSEDSMIYVSAAKGFRSGKFNLLGQPKAGPESVWTYELGVKATMLDGMFDGEIALFYSDYKDYQIFGIFQGTGVGIMSNGGKARIKGVEWIFDWNMSDHFTISFDGNYVDAKFVEINATSTAYIVGDPIDYIPKYQLTVSAKYDFEWQEKSGFIRLDYNQVGRSVQRNRSIGPQYFGQSDEINMLNFNIGLQWNDSLSFGVYAKNILNDRGQLHGGEFLGAALRSRPRTFGLQMGLGF
ncbi:TonB-dependent receptor domain-containing protein [Paremcibacter congregatus]|nr:TonB-dependent receptor [Paremcibacter congregatus]QDE27991.1 TonB-dependent receptor [Paremcibacter congregatus]